jgi:hypothetical protein
MPFLHRQRVGQDPCDPDNVFRFRGLLLIALASLIWISVLHADTTWVAGEVYGTWTRDGNPYLVTDTLTIPTGLTLNIQPGVEIWFLDQEMQADELVSVFHTGFRKRNLSYAKNSLDFYECPCYISL